MLIPFRSLLHMETDADRRAVLRAVAGLLAPGGRFIFDVFAPGADDIAETHGRWLEREPGIWERADWNEETRTLILRVRGTDSDAEMSLAWLAVGEWEALLRGGLRRRRALRLVRPLTVARRRGHGLGLPAGLTS